MDPVAQAPKLAPAALAVTIVHGTFPRGSWQQLRRNLRTLWTRLRGRPFDEAAMWPAPASQPDQRWWFESGSKFERDIVRRSGLHVDGLDVVFDHFLWSGCNGFADRADAARSLRAALRESARKHPGVPQVVLAHSHGGTVAVKALDDRDEYRGGGETPNVRALLTLGTPFVRLVWRSPRVPGLEIHEPPPSLPAELPRMLRLLAPIMALDLLVRSDGILQAVPAGVLVIAALVALLRASPVGATTVIAIALGLGGWVLLWHFFAAALLLPVVFLLTLMLLPKSVQARLADRQATAYWRLGNAIVENEMLCLLCPLLALRAPRDEASLVIGLAQLVQGLWHTGARFADLVGRWLMALFGMKFFFPLMLGALWLVALVLGLVDLVYPVFDIPAHGAEWLVTWVTIVVTLPIAVLSVALIVLVCVLLAALVTGVLVWALPAMVISLTTGREAFLLPGVTQLDAEPLPDAFNPDGPRRADMDLEILYEARLTGLNHSLYDAPEVRERIAIWLREQAGLPPVWRVAKPIFTREVSPNL